MGFCDACFSNSCSNEQLFELKKFKKHVAESLARKFDHVKLNISCSVAGLTEVLSVSLAWNRNEMAPHQTRVINTCVVPTGGGARRGLPGDDRMRQMLPLPYDSPLRGILNVAPFQNNELTICNGCHLDGERRMKHETGSQAMKLHFREKYALHVIYRNLKAYLHASSKIREKQQMEERQIVQAATLPGSGTDRFMSKVMHIAPVTVKRAEAARKQWETAMDS
eukprot:gene15085-4500_t